jgi:hypothetical protein
MFYDFSFTIPKTATAANRATKDLKLTYGIVNRVTMFWWPGPHGLVHVVITQGGHQVLPTNPDASFNYDNYCHVMDERIPLLVEPYTLRLEGWADGCDYDHEVKVGIGILPPESFPEYQKPDTLGDALLRALHLK